MPEAKLKWTDLQRPAICLSLLCAICLAICCAIFLQVPSYAQGLETVAQEKSSEPLYLEEFLSPNQTIDGINLDIKMKRPMLMFRHALNKRWRPVAVFFIALLLALITRLMPRGLKKAAIISSRSAVIASLSYALLFSAACTILTRIAFALETTVPLALLSLGLMELFFFAGMGLGVNLICDRVMEMLSEKTFPKEGKSRKFIEVLVLIGACFLIAALSLIPGLGKLPRLGNRVLVFLAMLGLGGLLRALYKRYDQVES